MFLCLLCSLFHSALTKMIDTYWLMFVFSTHLVGEPPGVDDERLVDHQYRMGDTNRQTYLLRTTRKTRTCAHSDRCVWFSLKGSGVGEEESKKWNTWGRNSREPKKKKVTSSQWEVTTHRQVKERGEIGIRRCWLFRPGGPSSAGKAPEQRLEGWTGETLNGNWVVRKNADVGGPEDGTTRERETTQREQQTKTIQNECMGWDDLISLGSVSFLAAAELVSVATTALPQTDLPDQTHHVNVCNVWKQPNTHTRTHTHTQLVNACLDNVYACHPSHKHTITLSMRVMMRQKCVSTCVYKDKSLRESFHLVSVSENKHKSVSVYHLGQCWVKQRTQQTKKHKSLRNLLSFHKC